MEAQVIPTQQVAARRVLFPAIRWSAVFAGTVAGIASYVVLSLIGIAIGITAVEPTAAEPIGAAPLITGIWVAVSMLVAAFIGGYVAARMSGLSRRIDGLLHGFVAWATTVLLFSALAISAVGGIVGGAFGVLGQGMQAAGEAGGGEMQSALGGIDASPQNLAELRDIMSTGDRDSAVQYMVSEMNMSQEQASGTADRLMPLFGPEGRERAQQAVDVTSAASWSLIVGILLSLGVGLWGGLVGCRANSNRTIGDHSDERHFRTF